MDKSHMLLAAVVAGASFAALADDADSWKGTLTRAEVTAAFLQARASGTLPSGEAYDDPVAMKMAAAPATTAPIIKRPGFLAPQAMGAGAGADEPLTLDNYRFVGGEAGYAPADAPR
jgi:hypothetical protein